MCLGCWEGSCRYNRSTHTFLTALILTVLVKLISQPMNHLCVYLVHMSIKNIYWNKKVITPTGVENIKYVSSSKDILVLAHLDYEDEHGRYVSGTRG